MKMVKLNKKEVEYILYQIEGICDSHSLRDDIYTFKKSDYNDVGQSELNTMKSLKLKLVKE